MHIFISMFLIFSIPGVHEFLSKLFYHYLHRENLSEANNRYTSWCEDSWGALVVTYPTWGSWKLVQLPPTFKQSKLWLEPSRFKIGIMFYSSYHWCLTCMESLNWPSCEHEHRSWSWSPCRSEKHESQLSCRRSKSGSKPKCYSEDKKRPWM